MTDIYEILIRNGWENGKAWDLKTAFYQKYGYAQGTIILATLENDIAVLEYLSKNAIIILRFDIVKRSFDDCEFGEFPNWIIPIRVDKKLTQDYSGWKEIEYRGIFAYNGKTTEGLFISHFHIDRQKDNLYIESIFLTEQTGDQP